MSKENPAVFCSHVFERRSPILYLCKDEGDWLPTPPNQAQLHHDPSIVGGGGRHSNPVVLCPECHVGRHFK